MDVANKKAGRCKFTVSNNQLTNDTSYAAYAYPKNWRYTHAIQHKSVKFWKNVTFSTNFFFSKYIFKKQGIDFVGIRAYWSLV